MKRYTTYGPAKREADRESTIWCSICGRPLARGEDFGQWRIRAWRPSSRWQFRFATICPLHYGEPARATAERELEKKEP